MNKGNEIKKMCLDRIDHKYSIIGMTKISDDIEYTLSVFAENGQSLAQIKVTENKQFGPSGLAFFQNNMITITNPNDALIQIKEKVKEIVNK